MFIRARTCGARWSRRVHSGSLGSSNRTLGFIRALLRDHRVHLGALWGLAFTFRFVGFIRGRSGGRCVYTRAPYVSLGSLGFIRYIRARHGVVRFISALDSFGRILGVVRLMQARI